MVEVCRIVNGRKCGDSTGRKTCHQWNGISTVDYILADKSIFHLILTYSIHKPLDHLSDLCPFSVVINLNCVKRNSKVI